jgi:hypothetical protein
MGVVIFASTLARAELQTRTLTRTEDFVIFTGADVYSLIGTQVGDLHLFAYSASGLRAIPFQVDKRDAEGRFVFPDETMRDPARDGTRLDSNDEMVFMIMDAGDKCPEKVLIEAGASGMEIELVDPLDGRRAWAYLLERPGTDPPPTDDYVSYRVEDDNEYVSSDQYEIGKGLALVGYDWLRLRRPDGEWGQGLLDYQTTWVRARLLKGAIPVFMPGREARCRTLAVIDGPVRVIRDEMEFARVKFIGLEMVLESFVTYYYNGHITPVDLKLPFTLNKTVIDINIYWALVFTDAIIGSTYFSQANPEGVLLDGKPDPDLDTESDNTYMVVSGPEGSILEVIAWSESIEPYQLIRTSLVHDDLTQEDSSKLYPGDILAGYKTTNSKRLPKGTYQYSFCHYYPYPFSHGKIQEVLNMIEQPVEVKVHPLSNQTQ